MSAVGHHLEAIVYVGRAGVTEGVCEALSQALADHELVKAKMQDIPGERKACALALADKTQSALVQLLGKTALYFKAKPEGSRFSSAPSKTPSRAKPAEAAPKTPGAPRALAKKPVLKKAPAKKPAIEKAPAKKSAIKKVPAKKLAIEKVPAKKSAIEKVPGEKAVRQASKPRFSTSAELSRKAWLERAPRAPKKR